MTETENKTENMTEGPIRQSEDPLLVFISSRQDPEMSRARTLAINEVDHYPGMKVWAFEDAPASSEAARDRYIRNASRANIVIWLIGSTTTTPVAQEVNACRRAQGSLLAFKLPANKRDDETEALIKEVSDYATWKTVENIDDLTAHIRAALTDEILQRYRDPAPVNHDLYLTQKYRESIAETKRLWTTLGVPEDIASELSDDHSVGHRIALPTKGTLGSVGGDEPPAFYTDTLRPKTAPYPECWKSAPAIPPGAGVCSQAQGRVAGRLSVRRRPRPSRTRRLHWWLCLPATAPHPLTEERTSQHRFELTKPKDKKKPAERKEAARLHARKVQQERKGSVPRLLQ